MLFSVSHSLTAAEEEERMKASTYVMGALLLRPSMTNVVRLLVCGAPLLQLILGHKGICVDAFYIAVVRS